MGKRKNQALIDSDTSSDNGSASDLDSVSTSKEKKKKKFVKNVLLENVVFDGRIGLFAKNWLGRW